MKRALRIFGGVVSAALALLMLVLFLFAASSTQHTLRSHEPAHLEAAVQFVKDRQLRTGVIPEDAEFQLWATEMDRKGFRFEGNGFTLDKRCGFRASEFCIYFSTGDGFVTYSSWQQSMEKVKFDESPLPWAFAFFLVGLVSAIVAKVLLVPGAARLGSEPHSAAIP
jgi:hypothetical protein